MIDMRKGGMCGWLPAKKLAGKSVHQRVHFAWLKVPEGYTSEAFSDLLLEKAHVVVAPGNGFGAHGEGYVRVGLLTSEERLQEAAQRIAALKLFEKPLTT